MNETEGNKKNPIYPPFFGWGLDGGNWGYIGLESNSQGKGGKF